MTEPIDIASHDRDSEARKEHTENNASSSREGIPSNPVYARVGDAVLRAAQEGVRRGLTPQDIVRQIVTDYDVRLNVGELRLLLASRRVPK
ncbi:MAG: hypothetical protein NVS2B16_28940 [Chloroflexota bacterium]